ncbi:MAG: Crp/Fnr family transcriptional regulator [Candidatus Gastranaerophilales bacterium]|nr:Crp/Fnr family transcriptional regulator [Candidatus Gastranaerophilales bacterium]
MNIFDGIDEKDFEALTCCIQAVKKAYKKDEIIFNAGDKITSVCYVAEGKVQLVKDGYDGNKIIITNTVKGETFAEAFIFAEKEKSSICAIAMEDTQILFLNCKKILSICSNSCRFHKTLLENIVKIIATRNILLQERIELLSKKTLRDRILYMLFKEKTKHKTNIFEITYSREQMAEYIGADRSALSRELSKMKQEKILDYHKNSFKLY